MIFFGMLRCCNGLGRCVFLRIFLRISGKSWVYRHLSPILGKCSLCYIPCLLSGTLRKHCTSAPPCVFPNFSFIFCTAFWSSVVIHSDSHIRLTLCERKEELKHSWKQRRTKEPLDESERGEWKTWLKTQRWKKRPFPSPGDLPGLGIKPRSPTLQADALTTEPPGKPQKIIDQELIVME